MPANSGQPEEERGLRSRDRPGDQTARYIDKILMRLTLVGRSTSPRLPAAGVPDPEVERTVLFRRHSLLILVVVTMDFMAQVQAFVMSHQYESLLKRRISRAGLPGR